jgi:polysaccharide biosynthesis/export protein
MQFNRSLSLILGLFMMSGMLTSCVSSKKVAYLDNIPDTVVNSPVLNYESIIQRNDLLNITVSSLNPAASSIFNSPNLVGPVSGMGSNSAIGQGNLGGSTSSSAPAATGQQAMGYLVDGDGNIKFPVLGAVKAEGLTKRQLEDKLSKAMIDKKLLLDPIVSVRFTNFRVTVLGEVARPTTINVTNERISLLEALGLAGDLTIYGKRENVLLIREEGNKKIIRRIDLTSRDILSSPYYYLKTNDVVYVEPNTAKIASTSRTQQLLPIVLSALSFIAVIVTYSLRNN